MVPSLVDAVTTEVVVLDGGLATELERRGNDLSSALWSARLLADEPAEIVAAHKAFVSAGARVAISASYQASFDGLGGDPERAADLMRRSVELARAAGPEWVAASVGPYGAVLADGSEYRGDYGLTVRELRAFHRPRLQVLADAGADVLAVETIPCLAEVEALLGELDELDVPAWLSLTCAGTRTRAGEPAAQAFAMAADCPSVFAVGVNCVDPVDAADLVSLAAEQSGKPVVVYPNSGETWADRGWTGSPDFDPRDVSEWVRRGARLVGGCCRVGPADIGRLAGIVSG
jgi:S-methylmethionine-dependent homocysteine/selenocysteine methylase